VTTRCAALSVADLIDPRHYAVQARQPFATAEAAYNHFVSEGQARGLDPSPYFSTTWYAWQNATRGHCVLTHFLQHAGERPIDPAPFVDTVGLLRRSPEPGSALELYRMLLRGEIPDMPPSYDAHVARLNAARDAFHARVSHAVLRDQGRRRRNLVWIQSGNAFRLPAWFRFEAGRDWDLLLNWYDLRGVDLRFGDIVLRQSGTKFTGIHHVLSHHPTMLTRYDAVLFLDDDLIPGHDNVDRVFDLAATHGLDLFQPSLKPGAHCSWPDLFHRGGPAVRQTTGVEIMMFGFSRRALESCAPLFGESVSGFGLDFACSEAVRDRGWSCGVVDAVQVDHPDAIDEAGGSYYEFMRASGINQKLELAETIRRLGRLPEFVTLDAAQSIRWPASTQRAAA
jgi:hypothetical protein